MPEVMLFNGNHILWKRFPFTYFMALNLQANKLVVKAKQIIIVVINSLYIIYFGSYNKNNTYQK